VCLYLFLLLDFGFPCWFWSVRAQVLEEIAAWPHAHGTSPAQPRAAPARAALRPGTAPAASRGTCIPGEALQARPGAARHVRARPCRSDARRPLPSRPQLLAAASCRHAQACARGAGGLRPASPAARGARPSAAERQEQGPGCSREACPGTSTSRSNKQRSQGQSETGVKPAAGQAPQQATLCMHSTQQPNMMSTRESTGSLCLLSH